MKPNHVVALLFVAVIVSLLAGSTGCETCIDSGELCPPDGPDGCCSGACEEWNTYMICS